MITLDTYSLMSDIRGLKNFYTKYMDFYFDLNSVNFYSEGIISSEYNQEFSKKNSHYF